MALWTPANLPSLLVWLNVRNGDANITYGTGADVATWGRHGSTAYDATTIDSAKRPTYSATGLEGSLPCVEFARDTDQLLLDIHGANTTSNIFNQAYSFGMVVQPTFASDFLSVMVSYDDLSSDTDTIAPLVRSVFNSGQDVWIGRAGNTGTGTPDVQWPTGTSTAAIFTSSSAVGISGGSVSAMFSRDGTALGYDISVSGFGTPSKRGILLGYPDWDIGGGTKIGEFVFCNAALSTGDRQRLEGYLAWNWGKQASLPGGHPYAGAAPTVDDDGENTVARDTFHTDVPGAYYTLRDAYVWLRDPEENAIPVDGAIPNTGSYWLTWDGALAAFQHIDARSYPVLYGDPDWQAQQEIVVGGYTLVADGGSVAITGTAATLRVARRLVCDGGSVTITGTAASLEYNRRLVASGGSYTITGTAATLRLARRLVCSGGSYTITGTAATLRVSRRLVCSGGTVTITGTNATLTKTGNYSINAETGAVAITGTDATLRVSRRLVCEAGSITITGTDATLTYDGSGEPPEPESPAGWQGPVGRKARKALRKLRKKIRKDAPETDPTVEDESPEPRYLPGPTLGQFMDGIADATPAPAEPNRAEIIARRAAVRDRLIAERNARLAAEEAERQRIAYDAMIRADDEEAMAFLLPYL